MNYIFILIDVIAVFIFCFSFLIAFFVYQNTPDIMDRYEKTSIFSFYLSIFIGAIYFLYSLSNGMTLDNIGNYLTVLMLVIIYPTLVVLAIKLYKQRCLKLA